MKCPLLLHNLLRQVSPHADRYPISIIQLSYENYDDPEQGRRDVSADTFVSAADRKRLSYLYFFRSV